MLNYNNYIKSTAAYKNAKIDFEKGRLAHTYLVENKDIDLCFSFAKFLAALIIKGENPDSDFSAVCDQHSLEFSRFCHNTIPLKKNNCVYRTYTQLL